MSPTIATYRNHSGIHHSGISARLFQVVIGVSAGLFLAVTGVSAGLFLAVVYLSVRSSSAAFAGWPSPCSSARRRTRGSGLGPAVVNRVTSSRWTK